MPDIFSPPTRIQIPWTFGQKTLLTAEQVTYVAEIWWGHLVYRAFTASPQYVITSYALHVQLHRR